VKVGEYPFGILALLFLSFFPLISFLQGHFPRPESGDLQSAGGMIMETD
jgi:hypothetical protein